MSEEKVDETGIVDAKNFKVAERAGVDPLEKEEAEAAKKLAKPAPSGAYICTANILCDNKNFKKGDVYDGKLYADLLKAKVIVPKEEWAKRP